jgi:hypothetical protein
MKVLIGEHEWLFANEIEQVDLLFKKLNSLLESNDLNIINMVVDGAEIYQDYYKYIIIHLNSIQIIQVEAQPVNHLIEDIFSSTRDYLIRSIPEIRKLADQLYIGPTQNSWTLFEQFIEGVQWIIQMLDLVDKFKHISCDTGNFRIIATDIKGLLIQMEEAMQDNDTTAIADFLIFEIVPVFESLLNQVANTINNEGKSNDLNQ